MAFWPITFTVEWVIIPFFGLLFLSQRGRVSRAFSIYNDKATIRRRQLEGYA